MVELFFINHRSLDEIIETLSTGDISKLLHHIRSWNGCQFNRLEQLIIAIALINQNVFQFSIDTDEGGKF